MSTADFNNLILNHSEELKPFAISLTRHHEDAIDLCQETLFKAFVYRNNYEQGTNIKAWLYTIMRNIFINDYRRKARKKNVLDAIRHSQELCTTSSDISLRLKEVSNAVHKLPAIFKTAFLLYLQGYKYNEIAIVLDEPLGTIKSRIHFAKKLLQKQLDR